MHSHVVSTAGVSCKGKGWERHLVLCQEVTRSVSQRRSKANPAITTLAVSRWAKLCSQHKDWLLSVPVNHFNTLPELSACFRISRCLWLKALIEARCLLCRTHATLLAGDAWGRVFTWTCEWEMAVLAFSPHFSPPFNLPFRLWHMKKIHRCLRSGRSWAMLSFREVCVTTIFRLFYLV